MTDNVETPIAARIRQRLKSLHLDPTPASKAAGMSASGIRNILEGKSRSPRGETLTKLATVLQTSVEWLTTGSGEEFVEAAVDHGERDTNAAGDGFGVADLGDGKGHTSRRLSPKFIPEFQAKGGASLSGGTGIEVPVTDQHGNTYTGSLARAEWSIPDYYLAAAGLQQSRIHILEVDGPSMIPVLHPEDRVLVDTSDTNPGIDGIFAIWDDSTQSVIIKNVQVVRGTSPTQINCISSNTTYAPFVLTLDGATRIIGRVRRRITAV